MSVVLVRKLYATKFQLEDLLKLLQLGCYHHSTISLIGICLEVILMVVFSLVELVIGDDFSHYGILPSPTLIQLILDSLSNLSLFFTVIEDC